MNEMDSYAYKVTVNGTFQEVVDRVTEALKTEGFGVLTTIDVAGTLKAKLGVEKKPYVILGACNPQYVDQALEVEPDIGTLLPCNVVVREEANGTMSVSFMNPLSVLGLVANPQMEELGEAVWKKLKNVIEMISS